MSEQPRPSETELHGLALSTRAGDTAAHSRWYQLEFEIVWRLALGILADAAEADDVAQETMLHLNSKLTLWDSSRPYTPWRNSIVINRCRDRLRRVEARRNAEQDSAEARLPDKLPDPTAAAEASETRAILQTCLAALSPREREVFVLRDLEGQSTRQVAAALGIVESSVRSLSTLARRSMRTLLEKRVPGLVAELERPDA